MSDLLDTPVPPPLPPLPAAAPDWQPLPVRSAWLAAFGGAIAGALMIGGVLGALWVVFDLPGRWWGAAGMVVLLDIISKHF